MFFSKYFSAVLAFIALFFLSGALVAFAGTMDIEYKALAPLPLGKDGSMLGTYTISTYLSGMFKLIIALGAAFAVVMGITGGIQYVASGIAPAARKGAKERITNAVIGLVIVLTSYLILNTIDPKLVAFNFQLEPVKGTRAVVAPEVLKSSVIQSSDKCAEVCGPGSSCMSFINTFGEEVASCQPTPPTACVRPQTGTAWPSDAYERGVLRKNNILVNKANCTTINQSGCTSVCGLELDVIDEIADLKEDCDNKMGASCNVMVNGATEYWLHQSHGNNRNVDLAMNKETPSFFDKYIRSMRYIGTGQTCGIRSAPHWDVGMAIFVDEGDHWHACF